jgi:hypothetical protein
MVRSVFLDNPPLPFPSKVLTSQHAKHIQRPKMHWRGRDTADSASHQSVAGAYSEPSGAVKVTVRRMIEVMSQISPQ